MRKTSKNKIYTKLYQKYDPLSIKYSADTKIDKNFFKRKRRFFVASATKFPKIKFYYPFKDLTIIFYSAKIVFTGVVRHYLCGILAFLGGATDE